MTTNGSHGGDPAMGSWPPGLGPALPHDLAPEPAPRRTGRRAGVTALAGVLVMGSLGFAAINLSSGDGASSPEAAVEAFFDAVDQEDAIGVVESLEPSERRLVMSTLRSLETEGERLGLTDPEADLHGVQGVDLEVRDLGLRTEELADGVVAVELSGSISSSTDLRSMPFGPVVEDAIGRARDDGEGFDDTESDAMDLDGGRLVAVRRDGGWHVSAMASIAEAARRDQDDPPPFPDPADAIPAVGADSPEAAVREAIDAATSADLRRFLELMDPKEAEVLHRYGPLFVDEVDEGDDPGIEISDLALQVSDGPGGDKVVTATSVTMTIADDESVFTTSYADGCSEISYSYTDEYKQEYLDEWGDEEGDASWLDGDTYRFCKDDALGPWAVFGAFESPGLLSVVVAEHDGSWYIRPAATIVETFLDLLRGVDRDQLERSVRLWTGEYWLEAPDSFWEACGVDRPADDADRADAEAAYEDCQGQLPDDYDYDDWPLGGLFSGFGSYDDSFDEGSYEDYQPGPEEACYSDEVYESEDPTAAIVACLQDLADQGLIDQTTVDEARCDAVYDDIGWDDELSEDEVDALYEQADAAYEACLDGEGVPTTTVPAAPTTTRPAPTTTAPPATTTAPAPTTTAPPATTTTLGG